MMNPKGLALTFAENVNVWSLKGEDLIKNKNSFNMPRKKLVALYSERGMENQLVENIEDELAAFQFVEIDKSSEDEYQFKTQPGDKLIKCEHDKGLHMGGTIVILHMRKYGEDWKVVFTI